mgnify:CR=1 FL=1
MQLNKYQERIIEIGQKKSAKLILPEIWQANNHSDDYFWEIGF